MPNWCENQLTVVGPDEELKRLRVVARRDGDEGIKEFSLEELLPTPPELLKGDKWYDWRKALGSQVGPRLRPHRQ